MTLTLSAFFRCHCGKLHARSNIGPLTTCPQCGRNLWGQTFGKDKDNA